MDEIVGGQYGYVRKESDREGGMIRHICPGSNNKVDQGMLTSLFPPSAPLKMFESRFESIEKMTKKQNKEQVPPPAETESKKPVTSKTAKRATNSNTVSQPTHKNLEEAFKAVSESTENNGISNKI